MGIEEKVKYISSLQKDDLVATYIYFRKEKEAAEERHKQELNAIEEKLILLRNELRERCKEEGVSQFKTSSGLVYLIQNVKYEVDNWEAFREWLKNKVVNSDDPVAFITGFFQKRIMQSRVKELMELSNEVPMGMYARKELSVIVKSN
jgi:hypothetical protein